MIRVCRVSTSNQGCKNIAKLNCVSCEIAISRNSCFIILRKLAIFRNPFYNSASNNTSKSSYNHGLEIWSWQKFRIQFWFHIVFYEWRFFSIIRLNKPCVGGKRKWYSTLGCASRASSNQWKNPRLKPWNYLMSHNLWPIFRGLLPELGPPSANQNPRISKYKFTIFIRYHFLLILFWREFCSWRINLPWWYIYTVSSPLIRI